MTDLYEAEVLEQEGKKARLRLHLTRSASSVFVGPSFAQMLIAEEASPGFDAYRAWLRARYEEDEDFDSQATIAEVRVVSFEALPRDPTTSFASLDPSGSVDLEISVDEEGMLTHLTPGLRWWSTAFDELGDGTPFTGRAEEARVWTRPAAVPAAVTAIPASSGLTILARSREGLLVEVVTTGELPATTPTIWLDLIRVMFFGLEKVRAPDAAAHLASIEVLAIEGTRDPGKGKVSLTREMSLRAVRAVRARYQIKPASATWLDTAPVTGTWLDSWFPARVLVPAPRASASGDRADFTELLELARAEGLESELGLLGDGLSSSREVVLDALHQAAALGERAAPLAPAIGLWVGCLEETIALAALNAATAVKAPSLGAAVALATHRTSPRVAEAARRALTAFPAQMP